VSRPTITTPPFADTLFLLTSHHYYERHTMNVGLPTTLIAAAVLALTGCGGSPTPAPTPSTNPSTAAVTTAAPEAPVTGAAPKGGAATASAKNIQAMVPSVVKVVTITEKNDPNPIFGRPGAYISAAVIYDEMVKCTTLVVGCGAKVEVYKSTADATARAKYLLGMKRDGMIPAGESDYVRGVSVLRVFGGLTPALAETYNAAFGGELAKLGTAPAGPHPTA
jgi:hypothetical protein